MWPIGTRRYSSKDIFKKDGFPLFQTVLRCVWYVLWIKLWAVRCCSARENGIPCKRMNVWDWLMCFLVCNAWDPKAGVAVWNFALKSNAERLEHTWCTNTCLNRFFQHFNELNFLEPLTLFKYYLLHVQPECIFLSPRFQVIYDNFKSREDYTMTRIEKTWNLVL